MMRKATSTSLGRPLKAEDGTAALHGFWLNLNWKDGLDCGLNFGAHCFLPDDKPARPAEMPETDPDAHRWKQISEEGDDRDLHRPVTAFTSFPILEEVGCAALMAFQHEASMLRRQLRRPLKAEDGTAALHGFWLNLNWKDELSSEFRFSNGKLNDKPARPAEMPETDPDAHRWKQISEEGDDRDLHHPVTASTSFPILEEVGCAGLMAFQHEASLLRRQLRRPLKAEDGTAALHGFWLNLNWKDGLDCGLHFGAHCFLPDDKPARPAEMPETDPDAHRWKQISEKGDDRDLHRPVTAFTSFPILEEVGCAALMAFQHEASLLRRQLRRPPKAEDGTAALHGFWLNLNWKDELSSEFRFSNGKLNDKPARPAEMPETDPDAHRWKQISQEGDDRDLHHPVTAFTSFPILEEVGCAALMAFQHEASLLRRQLRRPLKAEDGTAAFHGFWLNLNWKDEESTG
ncbi:hypothetical protein Bbelb_125520 [Branchiostoma belcheri]|nr:hypothetical protein Bbelb_125520 [Branchiostoma belcheri]